MLKVDDKMVKLQIVSLGLIVLDLRSGTPQAQKGLEL